MTPAGQTICLCMIVKNEARVIRRCLDSVRPIIDRWLIVDTGSTDGTQDIIRAALADLPGELVERPWRDFATNRSESLALARPWGHYSLIIDADDTLEIPAGYSPPDLTDDSYLIDIDFNGTTYQRPHLVKAALKWRYEGVLHEYLECEAAQTKGHLPIVMRIVSDGARRHDPDTYRRDAALLEDALTTETRPMMVARYTFYLAQSYRDCGEQEKALAAYLRRADLGFWAEEVYCALLGAGRLQEALGEPFATVLATYDRAMRIVAMRAEAPHGASRLCRLAGEYVRGAEFGRIASGLTIPSDGLFVERWIYDYGAHDEYAVNAYWAGLYRESLDASLCASASDTVPPGDRARLIQNARFALEKLPTAGAKATRPASPVAPAPVAVARVDLAAELGLPKRSMVIADVGAAFFGETQLYQPLLDRELGALVCFEPDPGQVGALKAHLGDSGLVVPCALGDGHEHTLYAAPGGMSSLLEPDQDAYNLYSLFAAPPFSPIRDSVEQTRLQTRRLDDIADISSIDFLKIDIQGSELMVLRHGARKLAQCAVIQIEVPFVPLYKGAPTFGDIDAELRHQGFMVHGLATLKRLPIAPYRAEGELIGINQLIDLDMIYIRTMTKMAELPDALLAKTAIIADACYCSFDLALRCLTELGRRNVMHADIGQRYLQDRRTRQRVGIIHHTPTVQIGGT